MVLYWWWKLHNISMQSTYLSIFGWIILTILLIGGLLLLTGQGNNNELAVDQMTQDGSPVSPFTPEERNVVVPENINMNNQTVILRTNKGDITLELYNEQMPVTAGNFIQLVNEGFYNGTLFHRVIDGFMIQGGDPNTKGADVMTYGTGGPGYAIPDEHIVGEGLSNLRGTISMANSGPNSGGSQFFINVADNVYLDFDKEPLQSKHPVFGRVIDGMDVVDAIAQVEVDSQSNLPVDPVKIESAEVIE